MRAVLPAIANLLGSGNRMSFSSLFRSLPLGELVRLAETATPAQISAALAKDSWSLADLPLLLSDAAAARLETLGQIAQSLTRRRFGRVIRLFAPLYLSNECVNNCKYCGFSRDNPILRVTLTVDQVVAEARALVGRGFRNILLVAGEHPKFVSNNYLRDCVRALQDEVPSISLEVGPMEAEEYQPIRAAGAEGLVVYQETYNRDIYAEMHTAGPKRDFDWRLDTPERAYAAGFKRLGVGALHGLADWRFEALALAHHAGHLLRHCWKSSLTLSFPRLRPNAGGFDPLTHLGDRQLAQLLCACRMVFPDVGLVLSTREPARLRDGLIPLGVTHISAGSHTEPGGYTGAGGEALHRTEKGRLLALESKPVVATNRRTAATGQFDIADERTPGEMAQVITQLGLEPVWKDWDSALN